RIETVLCRVAFSRGVVVDNLSEQIKNILLGVDQRKIVLHGFLQNGSRFDLLRLRTSSNSHCAVWCENCVPAENEILNILSGRIFYQRYRADFDLSGLLNIASWSFAAIDKFNFGINLVGRHNDSFIREPDPRPLVNLKVLSKIPPLQTSYNGISDSEDYSHDLKRSFPTWSGFVMALFGFFCIQFGWHRLRNNRDISASTWIFIVGIVLFGIGLTVTFYGLG